jgi:hypothetical protein
VDLLVAREFKHQSSTDKLKRKKVWGRVVSNTVRKCLLLQGRVWSLISNKYIDNQVKNKGNY